MRTVCKMSQVFVWKSSAEEQKSTEILEAGKMSPKLATLYPKMNCSCQKKKKNLRQNNLSADNTEFKRDPFGFLFCVFHVDAHDIKWPVLERESLIHSLL